MSVVTIAVESAVRERMASGPFTVVDLYAAAERHASHEIALRVVNRVVQDASRSGAIYRDGGKRWRCRPEPLARRRRDDEESDIAVTWRAIREDRKAERAERAEDAERQMPELAEQVARLGLVLVRRSEYHYQIRKDGRCVAQWWPSGGKTMIGPRKGPIVETPAAFVRLLESADRDDDPVSIAVPIVAEEKAR